MESTTRPHLSRQSRLTTADKGLRHVKNIPKAPRAIGKVLIFEPAGRTREVRQMKKNRNRISATGATSELHSQH